MRNVIFILLVLVGFLSAQTTEYRDGIQNTYGFDKDGNFFIQVGSQKSVLTPGQIAFKSVSDSLGKKEINGIEDAKEILLSTKVYKTKVDKSQWGWKDTASMPDSLTKRATVLDSLENKTVIEWKELNQEKVVQTAINKKVEKFETAEYYEWMSKSGIQVDLQKMVAYLWRYCQDLETRVSKLEEGK